VVKRVIDQAEEIVILVSFLFTSEAIVDSILRAAERGVRIYVMTASERGLNLNRSDLTDNQRRRADEHMRVLDQIVGPCMVRTSSHWHAKFVLADPDTEHAAGVLLSANLNDGALLQSPEAMIVLTPDEVFRVFECTRVEFWSSEFEFREPRLLQRPRSLFQFSVAAFSRGIYTTTSDSNAIIDRICEMIAKSESHIFLSTYQMYLQSEVVASLEKAAQAGRKVQILVDSSDLNDDASRFLSKAGCESRKLDWIHAKMVLVDSERGLFTSQNMEKRVGSTVKRFELGIDLEGERLEDAQLWLEHWWSRGRDLPF